MKKALMILALLTTVSAFAQKPKVERSSISGHFSKPTSSQKGFFAGLEYMNLTDLHMKADIRADGESENFSQEGGMSMGAAGFRLGYNQLPHVGFGFDAGIQYLENINQSEFNNGDSKLQMIIPEANLKWAFHQYIYIYGGVNVAFFTGTGVAKNFSPGPGCQAGFGTRFNQGIALNAGYTLFTQKYSIENEGDFKADADVDFQLSGFSTNLTYTF